MPEPSIIALSCSDCPATWEMQRRHGGYPTRCSDCKSKARKARAARSNRQYAEKVKADGKSCAVDDCPRNAYCKGWCKNHYERWRRYGDVRTDIPLPEQYPTACTVEGCDRGGTIRLGLCPAHRQRLERTGDVGDGSLRYFSGFIQPGEMCEVDACDRPMVGRRMCKMHLGRWKNYGRVDAHMRPRRTQTDGTCCIRSCDRPAPPGEWCDAHHYGWLEGGGLPPRFHNGVTICVIDGCGRPERAYGWCGMHASRWLKHASTLPHLRGRHLGTAGQPCTADGCSDPILARLLCDKHYAQYRKDGQLGLRLPPSAEEIKRRADALRERDRVLSAARYAANPERYREKNNSYRRANSAKARLWDQRKRAMRRGARRIPYTVDQLAAKYAYWGDRCWMCGGPNEDLEHVKPLSRGGWDCLANIRPSCGSCNTKKWATWPYPQLTYGFLRIA